MTITEFKARVRLSDIQAWQVARLLGISESNMSQLCSGRRRVQDHFLERAEAALDLLEQAKTKAQEAEAKVLKKWPHLSKRFQ